MSPFSSSIAARQLLLAQRDRTWLWEHLDGKRTVGELATELAESRSENERLSGELDLRAADGARLRAGLAEATRERDQLARALAETTRERDELLESKGALEQIHQALSQARARLG